MIWYTCDVSLLELHRLQAAANSGQRHINLGTKDIHTVLLYNLYSAHSNAWTALRSHLCLQCLQFQLLWCLLLWPGSRASRLGRYCRIPLTCSSSRLGSGWDPCSWHWSRLQQLTVQVLSFQFLHRAAACKYCTEQVKYSQLAVCGRQSWRTQQKLSCLLHPSSHEGCARVAVTRLQGMMVFMAG